MKLLVLTTKFPSPNFPMSGSYKSEFALALKKKGVDVNILVPLPIHLAFRNGFSLGLDETYDGIKTLHPWYIKIPFGSGFLSGFQRFLFRSAIKKHLINYKKSGGKVIHSHSISLAGFSANYFKKLELLSVVSLHDHEVHDIKYRPIRYLKFIENEINKSDQLLCVSHRQMTELKASATLEVPHEVIPYGIKAQHEIKKLPSDFTISTVCRLVKTKGVHLLIRAIAEINVKLDQPIKLIIVGSGEYELSLKKLVAQLDQKANIQFYGPKLNSEVPNLIANTHLFVLPSYEEALGLVYFEAMSVKTPVVGVVGQGIADYVIHGENGYLVSPEDVQSLIDTLEELIEKPDYLNEVGQKGFEVFKSSNVEWSKNVSKHLEVYQRLLNT